MMDAFGIFEGGGAKGLAHIGALKAAELRSVRFLGVAGTSAGSIVASLVAAGYTADELFSVNDPNSLFQTDFTDFFDQAIWRSLEKAGKKAIGSLGRQYRFLRDLRRLIAFNILIIRHRSLISMLNETGGFLDTTPFESWLNQKLCRKLKQIKSNFRPSGGSNTVLFRDIPLPLKIIASDVQNRSIRVFSMPLDSQMSVSKAVAASISIPFLFRPVQIEKRRFVDGGVTSNFPAWVFDNERKDSPPLTPTLGFTLVEKPQNATRQKKGRDANGFSFAKHALDVFMTSVFGDNTLEKREVATLHEIPLGVGIGPLDFKINEERRSVIYNSAKSDAESALGKIKFWRSDESIVQQRLREIELMIRQALGHNGHLRINVMMPIDDETLRVIYTLNMNSEEDSDDKLSFRKGCGACGQCWEGLRLVLCDVQTAATTYADKWKMDKYQQRLVRRSTRALISVPIFNQRRIGVSDEPDILAKSFCGVLNIDSDDNILKAMAEIASKDRNAFLVAAASLSDVISNIA